MVELAYGKENKHYKLDQERSAQALNQSTNGGGQKEGLTFDPSGH